MRISPLKAGEPAGAVLDSLPVIVDRIRSGVGFMRLLENALLRAICGARVFAARPQQLGRGLAITALAITSAAAADWPVDRPPDNYPDNLFNPKPISVWESEFGGRYFFSSGKTQVVLFGPQIVTPNITVSRLTFRNLQTHSGEGFGRVEHASGFFIKGFAGFGAVNSGTLQDEDFPPFTFPYSSTNSQQRNGSLAYGTVDLGWAWRSEGLKLGFFAGYHHYFERVNAFGCAQTAANPFICVPSVPISVLGITEKTNWDTVRLGFSTEWRFRSGLRFSTEMAWIPRAFLDASDTHWLRIPSSFTGPTPEIGSGVFNVQIEAMLSYQFSPAFSAGIGGRFWNIGTTSGGATAHFETSAVGAVFPQGLSLRTERWGAFAQASYKFGDLRPTRFGI
jgi:hypothetical protein